MENEMQEVKIIIKAFAWSLFACLPPPFYFVLLFLLFGFLGLRLQHMEVPRLGVESELQLLAYTTAM